METLYLGIVAFLVILAVFDLVVGVSNDAVNFLNSAIGARVAKFRTILLIASAGVLAGAAMSDGMMDVARHGIMAPQYFTFHDVMCVFLAVMVTDVLLLDVFNTLGLPTSTTVSMVFELLGGAFAVALAKMVAGETGPDGAALTLGDLLNTSKALTCIIGIFLSVAVAFFFGAVVMWLSRVLLTFRYSGAVHWLSRGVVLFGTGLLAFSFASNDLVNFVGVPLTGLDAYLDFAARGQGEADTFLMGSLAESAHTPPACLLAAGVVMVLALVFSKKARNVVKTSVDLSRQDEGDEMFGSSAAARILVRSSARCAAAVASLVPRRAARWLDTRFDRGREELPPGAAFDHIRAAVNLTLAGALISLGTKLRLPLSTTYVTFMVAMGTSLADRAWSRESAVFRVTGVLSVIGGWFVTAGAAFIVCFLVTSAMRPGGFPVMLAAIAAAVTLLVRSNLRYARKAKEETGDRLFADILRAAGPREVFPLLMEHIRRGDAERLRFAARAYAELTEAFFHEEHRRLKQACGDIEDERKELKRQRRRELVALRKCESVTAIEKGTWFFLQSNAAAQLLYCLKRMAEPCREHVANNFSPVQSEYRERFMALRDEILRLLARPLDELLRADAKRAQGALSDFRRQIIRDMHARDLGIEPTTVLLNLVQESQEMLSALRHLARGLQKMEELPAGDAA